jgi:hypothetical protein
MPPARRRLRVGSDGGVRDSYELASAGFLNLNSFFPMPWASYQWSFVPMELSFDRGTVLQNDLSDPFHLTPLSAAIETNESAADQDAATRRNRLNRSKGADNVERHHRKN